MIDLDRVALPLLLEQTLRAMHQNGTLEIDKLLTTVHAIKAEKTIPLSTFSLGLYPLEALAFYLHDISGCSFAEIGRLLGRNERSVWASYQRAVQKRKETVRKKEKMGGEGNFHDAVQHQGAIHIPLTVLCEDGSLMFCLAKYLQNTYHWNNKQIAHALSTSSNSVATVLKRGAA